MERLIGARRIAKPRRVFEVVDGGTSFDRRLDDNLRSAVSGC
jgi:hypothetical protein